MMLLRLPKNKLFTAIILLISFTSISQTAIWIEDFDDGGGGRWTLENAPGSLNNPTPAGIVGLTYGTNDPVAHDNWVINDRNTPELDNNIAVGLDMSSQGQFVRGRHYACSAPSNLPNPFINGAQPGPNQSLHITAYPTCATLLYGGTAGIDDWNCISDPDNGDIQTQTEQIAYLNNNIDATGKCNLVLTADFFLGGDSDGIKSHGTILYSVDAGASWKVVVDNLSSCTPFLAGTCNNWHRRSFEIPADANNQNDIRIAFRWYDDGDINDTGDYALGASFNVDNVMITACDPPVAAFTVSQTTGCKGETFVFTDQSTVGDGIYLNCFSVLSGTCDISSWSWSITKAGGPPGGVTYVNGTSSSSQNPEVVFTANGTYNVSLTATNCGGNGVLSQSGLITIADCPPIANFITSQVAVCADPANSQDTVTFTDLSTTPSAPITNWSWSFSPGTVTYANGTNSSSQNIDVTFDAPGTYEVTLTVTSSEGNDSEIKTAYIEAIDCNCGGGGGGGPVTVFEEDFDGNGGAGSNWAVVNSVAGAEGDSPNTWYISSAELGQPAGTCGAAGAGDNSLHVGPSPFTYGDLGAAYDAGGLCGFLWCVGTNRRSYSVDINTTGVTGLTLNFNYIENGQGTTDDAIVEYSTNSGASWTTLNNPAKTSVCGSGQGLWTAYSFALPASCENISTLRIGFRWYNNDDATGTDPSFAVDDITIVGTGGGGSTANTWEGDVSNDWNTAGNWSSNAVPTSADDVLVPAQVDLCGVCVMPQISVPAFAKNVCNFGVITINTDNTLTIDGNLLNEGEITSTTVNPSGDVVFANTASIYKGTGTLYDVDVAVPSSDLTLETNMWPRSFNMSTAGTVDMDVYTLSVNRDFTKSAGTLLAVNGTVAFIDACGACLDQTNTTDVSINSNQIFGDMLVNKTTGIKASFVSAFNYTLNTPKTVTIESGILDANTFTLNGTGNLTMTGGELQLAKCATVLPELTGTYTLPAGKITFDGVCGQLVKQTSVVGTDYYKVEFGGSGVKSLTGNTNVGDSLVFKLPTSLGNYVDAVSDTLFVLNNNAGIVSHTGGHVLGYYNRAITPSGGDYIYHVGSDNSDGETYFEPIMLTPSSLTGTPSVTAKFLDLTPNPTAVVPNIVFGLPPAIDTITQVETEGYWHMSPYEPIIGGTYKATVSPDINYWTFAQPWGLDYHSLLKQVTEGYEWGYTSGGDRIDDSTTTTFSDFSNYALGYANDPLTPLAVELISFNVYCDGNTRHLGWATATESNSHSFIIERTTNGSIWEEIAQIPSAGNSEIIREYNYRDNSDLDKAYYRLSERDMDGNISVIGSVYADCEQSMNELDVEVYPNPTSGDINMNIFSTHGGEAIVRLQDMTGKEIFGEDIILKRGVNFSSYTEQLSDGVYFLSVSFGAEHKVIRITVVH